MADKEKNMDELPDLENCKAEQFSEWDYELVECLVENPTCNAALHFGYGFLCRHPQRKEIIEKLKAMKKLGSQQE